MRQKILSLCLIALMGFASPGAAESNGEALDVQILPGWRAADGTHVAAIEMTLAEGWKTYWRAPGDAGIPPQFDWRGSRNLSGVEISWPTPKAMSQNGMRAIGYDNKVTLPIRIAPKQDGKPVELSGRIEMGVCKDICIPVTLEVSQLLEPGVSKPDPQIAAAMADRPYSAKEAGVGRVTCQITPKGGGLHLLARIELPKTGAREVAIVETDNPQVWVAQAKTSRSGGTLIAETEMYHADGRAFALNRSGLRITVLGKSRAVDIQGCPSG